MDPVASLWRRQAGVATLAQLLAAGLTHGEVEAQIAGGRWRRYGVRCIVDHNSEPTRMQKMWVALLDNQVPAALAGMTALEVNGFRFFGHEYELIHVVIQHGSVYHLFPGVKVHESRRFDPSHIELSPDGLPHLPLGRSTLDAAAWQPYPRYACGVIAAAVQQRIVRPIELEAAMQYVGRIRHKQFMRLAIADIAGGAEALSEIDVARMCRRFGIVEPDRQCKRRDADGRIRYLDADWKLPDGSQVTLEIDGSHHLRVESWEADMRRQRRVGSRHHHVLRCTANEARYDQPALVQDLVAYGVPRVWVVRAWPGYSRFRV